MPVITISRMTGARGLIIGQILAERLGAIYLSQQVIAEVAARLGVSEEVAAQHDERAEPFIDRLARVLWLSNPGFGAIEPTAGSAPFPIPQGAYLEVTRQLIREAARTGNAVIFGHGAHLVLADQPGTLHVRCVAPLPFRVRTVVERRGMPAPQAERWIREEDRRRADYVRRYYNVDWRDPTLFHLIVNTALWGDIGSVDLILSSLDLLLRLQAG